MAYIPSWERFATEIGLEKGLKQGIEQGMQQGMQKGEGLVLITLLQRKFGEVDDYYQNRIAEADPDTLLAWAANILDAKKIADVFI